MLLFFERGICVSIEDLKEESRKIFAFAGVGLVATFVHLFVAWLVFFVNPSTVPLIANLIAFLFAFQISFFGHRNITFRSTAGVKKFIFVALLNFALNNGALIAIINIMNVSGFLSILISTFLTPGITYILSRVWAFK